MEKSKFEKEIEKFQPKKMLFAGLDKWTQKHRRFRKPLIFFCAFVLFILVPLWGWYKYFQNSTRILGETTVALEVTPPPAVPVGDDNPIHKRINDEKANERCNGAEFNILDGTLEPVGGERFTFEEEEDAVSVRETSGYQAVVRTPWGCKFPLEAKIRVYPVSGSSLGLIFEYENVFKTLVGDGDRKTVRVQQNKWNIRGDWPEVELKSNKLSFPIEDGEEIFITVKGKVVDGIVHVVLEVKHSKFQSSDTFTASFIPTGTNLNVDQSRKFRIGINDSFYKGKASIIKMDTFSVAEKEW